MLHKSCFSATFEMRPSGTHGRRSLLPEGSLCCDDIHARPPTPQEAALLAEPPAAYRPPLANRGGRDRGRDRRLPVVERPAQSVGTPDFDRLRFSRPRSRDADRGHLARLQPEGPLRPRLHRRHRQYATRRCHRHRAGDRDRHAGRHRAAVVELAVVAARRRLCRTAARHSPAAAIAVLVRADAGIAGGARRMEADRGRVSFQPGPGAAISPDRGSEPLGDRGRRRRADRALSAAAAIDGAADG